MIVRVSNEQPAVRQREADRVEEREQPLRERRARGRGRRPRRACRSTSASTTTETSTWRRDAPSVRSVANSRVRWAIVIESELAITNAPTKSAIAAEREQELPQERDERVRVLRVLRRLRVAASAPACPGGRIVLDLGDELLRARRPSFAATRIWSSLPSLPKSCCAVGRSKPASVAPPIDDDRAELDEARDPQRLDRALGLDADRPGRRRGPSCRRSTCRSRPRRPSARRPLTSVSELNDGCVGIDAEAEVRGAAEDDRLAVLADQLGVAADAADRLRRRPAAPSTSASSDSSNGGAVAARSVARGRTPTCR